MLWLFYVNNRKCYGYFRTIWCDVIVTSLITYYLKLWKKVFLPPTCANIRSSRINSKSVFIFLWYQKLFSGHLNCKLNSKTAPVLPSHIFIFSSFPVHHTGFYFHIFSGFLAIFILLSSKNNNESLIHYPPKNYE